MELYYHIEKIIEQWGYQILIEDRMINILSDMHAFSEFKQAKFIIKHIIQSNAIHKLLEIKDKKESMTQYEISNAIDRISYNVTNESSFKYEYVHYCLESLAYGINLISSVQSVSEDISEPKSFIGLWLFNYKDNKIMKLNIKPDGKALASSGSIYSWIPTGSNEILIYIDNIVCYRGKLIDIHHIEGVAYSEINGREWFWSASYIDYSLSKDNLISGTWVLVNYLVDLENNKITFNSDNSLWSELYGKGEWTLENGELKILTANGFITYCGYNENGKIKGKARNKTSFEWKFELERIV